MEENKKKDTDYKKMFQMGVIFFAVGITLFTTIGPAGIGIFGLGAIMMFVGGQHKDEWKKD
jgi:hypothetical protein